MFSFSISARMWISFSMSPIATPLLDVSTLFFLMYLTSKYHQQRFLSNQINLKYQEQKWSANIISKNNQQNTLLCDVPTLSFLMCIGTSLSLSSSSPSPFPHYIIHRLTWQHTQSWCFVQQPDVQRQTGRCKLKHLLEKNIQTKEGYQNIYTNSYKIFIWILHPEMNFKLIIYETLLACWRWPLVYCGSFAHFQVVPPVPCTSLGLAKTFNLSPHPLSFSLLLLPKIIMNTSHHSCNSHCKGEAANIFCQRSGADWTLFELWSLSNSCCHFTSEVVNYQS